MPQKAQIIYRQAKPEDAPGLESIDSSFTTNTIYTLTQSSTSGSQLGFTLTENTISPPLTKHFPDDSSDSDSESDSESGDPENSTSKNKNKDGHTYTLLASDPNSAQIIGFVSTSYSAWNKRLVITDIEINPSHRGQGIGRELIDRAEKHALAIETASETEEEEAKEKLDVKYLWLEVSNVNAPAIRSYLRMGFEACGVDASLYEGTEAKGEVAVFMWRKCQ